jgi:hypothetical protein
MSSSYVYYKLNGEDVYKVTYDEIAKLNVDADVKVEEISFQEPMLQWANLCWEDRYFKALVPTNDTVGADAADDATEYVMIVYETRGGGTYHDVYHINVYFTLLDALDFAEIVFENEHNRDNDCEICAKEGSGDQHIRDMLTDLRINREGCYDFTDFMFGISLRGVNPPKPPSISAD